ncbi:MAG: O-antigen ligase family protein [Patescibacteria group bacterium]|nr:O-antigen ligase family protein [Patescibacteria group bacterium]MCL5431664.1 O-antigen ligase family protein [Patescibacteria group bacterium]
METAVVNLLLILLPTQLGLHLWPSWAFVNGIRVDYFSPTLYLTDVLIFLLFLSVIFNLASRSFGTQFKIFNKYSIFKLLIFIGFTTLNIYWSLSSWVTLYKWLKVIEFGFLIWYLVKSYKLTPIKSGLKAISLLYVPVFYESILAIWQFVNQSSIGGFWYWLGERSFNSGTPGIANADVAGQLILRPYGTFPHPNILGGFLAVVLPLLLCLFLHNSRKLTAPAVIKGATLLLGYSTLFLSLSRTAILVGMAATFVVFWPKIKKRVFLLVFLVPLIFLLPRFAALPLETEPIIIREQLNSLAIEQFTHSPIWGTGLGTAPLYSIVRQPTHNIYLLLLAETGAIGLLGFLFLIRQFWSWTLAIILLLGLTDHYFLTLQQGQLLLAVVLGAGIMKRWPR